MDTGVVPTAAVSTVGDTAKRAEQEAARGAGTGVETCKICDKPGHTHMTAYCSCNAKVHVVIGLCIL